MTLLLALSTLLFAIAISLLDSDMLLPRLLLCVCLLCLFLHPLTVPPLLRIALARLILSFFPLSSLSSLLLFLPLSLNLSLSLPLSPLISFHLSFPPSVSFTLVDAPLFSPLERYLAFALSVIKFLLLLGRYLSVAFCDIISLPDPVLYGRCL